MPNKQPPAPLVLYVYHCDECGHRGQVHQPESQQNEHSTCTACGATVVAEWDGGVALVVNKRLFIESIGTTAAQWRTAHPEHTGGVVLIWKGAVYGWKNCLRDAHQEQPGAYAVDEGGHVFIAEGGNEYDGAKCWVAIAPAN